MCGVRRHWPAPVDAPTLPATPSRDHTPKEVFGNAASCVALRERFTGRVVPLAHSARTPPLIAPDPATAALGPALLRLHAALTESELWQAVRLVASAALPGDALTLEIGHDADGVPQKTYRLNRPATPRSIQRKEAHRAWMIKHPRVTAFRLTDIDSESPTAARPPRGPRAEPLLCVPVWRAHHLLGLLNFHRTVAQPDFSLREVQFAESLQPHLQTALCRTLTHEEDLFLRGHFTGLLEDLPVGMLLLDWELRPLWRNGEAAQACAVWNHGERRAAALNPRRAFRIPPALAQACTDLRAQWEKAADRLGDHPPRPLFLSQDQLGVHAKVTVRTLLKSPGLRPVFHIQLDYRRPRGDRNRQLSPGAVALLARLTAAEREVAIRVREGLRTEEIATEMRRSYFTVKTQLRSIFHKLGVHSRTRVAAMLNR